MSTTFSKKLLLLLFAALSAPCKRYGNGGGTPALPAAMHAGQCHHQLLQAVHKVLPAGGKGRCQCGRRSPRPQRRVGAAPRSGSIYTVHCCTWSLYQSSWLCQLSIWDCTSVRESSICSRSERFSAFACNCCKRVRCACRLESRADTSIY